MHRRTNGRHQYGIEHFVPGYVRQPSFLDKIRTTFRQLVWAVAS